MSTPYTNEVYGVYSVSLSLALVSCEKVISRYKFKRTLSAGQKSSTARNPDQESAMQSRILGTTMPVLEFTLDPNESVISEAGELSWMTSSIQMTTHTQFGGGGGIFGVLKRVAGGGSLFMTGYRAIGAAGGISFATKLPGHIVPIEVCAGRLRRRHRGLNSGRDEIKGTLLGAGRG
jgi:Mitochondrial biogenesis AIM24